MARQSINWTMRLLLVAFIYSLVTGCSDTPAPGPRVAAPFMLERLNGEPLSFPADTHGKPVIITFWADWCPACKGELQALEPLFINYRGEGLTILAVNIRQDRATAAAFTDPLKISYDVLLDTTGKVADAYGVIGLPTTVITDRQGRLQTRIVGEATPEIIQQVLERHL